MGLDLEQVKLNFSNPQDNLLIVIVCFNHFKVPNGPGSVVGTSKSN